MRCLLGSNWRFGFAFLDEPVFNVCSIRDHFAVQLFLSLRGTNFGFPQYLLHSLRALRVGLEALGLLGFDGLASEGCASKQPLCWRFTSASVGLLDLPSPPEEQN